MPLRFSILKDRGLIYVRYSGTARVEETARAADACSRHPDFNPAFSHIVDLSDVTDYERDFVKVMKLQAEKAQLFMFPGAETYMIYVAPTRIPREMARLAANSWRGNHGLIVRIVDGLPEALALLGLPAAALNALGPLR